MSVLFSSKEKLRKENILLYEQNISHDSRNTRYDSKQVFGKREYSSIQFRPNDHYLNSFFHIRWSNCLVWQSEKRRRNDTRNKKMKKSLLLAGVISLLVPVFSYSNSIEDFIMREIEKTRKESSENLCELLLGVKEMHPELSDRLLAYEVFCEEESSPTPPPPSTPPPVPFPLPVPPISPPYPPNPLPKPEEAPGGQPGESSEESITPLRTGGGIPATFFTSNQETYDYYEAIFKAQREKQEEILRLMGEVLKLARQAVDLISQQIKLMKQRVRM